jgi:hypothetical protein
MKWNGGKVASDAIRRTGPCPAASAAARSSDEWIK